MGSGAVRRRTLASHVCIQSGAPCALRRRPGVRRAKGLAQPRWTQARSSRVSEAVSQKKKRACCPATLIPQLTSTAVLANIHKTQHPPTLTNLPFCPPRKEFCLKNPLPHPAARRLERGLVRLPAGRTRLSLPTMAHQPACQRYEATAKQGRRKKAQRGTRGTVVFCLILRVAALDAG